MRYLTFLVFILITWSCIDHPKQKRKTTIQNKKIESKIIPEKIWNDKTHNQFDSASIENLEANKGFRKIKLGTHIDKFQFSGEWRLEQFKYAPELKIYKIFKSHTDNNSNPFIVSDSYFYNDLLYISDIPLSSFDLYFLHDTLVQIVLGDEDHKESENNRKIVSIENFKFYSSLIKMFAKPNYQKAQQGVKIHIKEKEPFNFQLLHLLGSLNCNEKNNQMSIQTKYVSGLWESKTYALQYLVTINQGKHENKRKVCKKIHISENHNIKFFYRNINNVLKELENKNDDLVKKENDVNKKKAEMSEF